MVDDQLYEDFTPSDLRTIIQSLRFANERIKSHLPNERGRILVTTINHIIYKAGRILARKEKERQLALFEPRGWSMFQEEEA